MSQDREQRTIEAMVEIYCHAHHARPGGLCGQCRELVEYALFRLGKCPFGPDKPVCAKCPIHCYRPSMREQIRDVMRFAGPRMALRHPALAVAHLIQQRRPAPERPRNGRMRNRQPQEGPGPGCPECEKPEN